MGCERLNLDSIVETMKILDIPLPEDKVWKILCQFLLALVTLESFNLVHGAIKGENIFMSENHDIKLSDFGNTFHSLLTSITAKTLRYLAPEVIEKSNSYTLSSDLWSVGVILYQLLEYRLPFDSSNLLKATQLIYSPLSPLTKKYSKSLKRVVEGLLVREVEKRLTLKELFSIPEIRDSIAMNKLVVPNVCKEKYLIEKEESVFDKFNIPKGLIGVERDVFLSLVKLMLFRDDETVRRLMGVSKETSLWVYHPHFIYARDPVFKLLRLMTEKKRLERMRDVVIDPENVLVNMKGIYNEGKGFMDKFTKMMVSKSLTREKPKKTLCTTTIPTETIQQQTITTTNNPFNFANSFSSFSSSSSSSIFHPSYLNSFPTLSKQEKKEEHIIINIPTLEEIIRTECVTNFRGSYMRHYFYDSVSRNICDGVVRKLKNMFGRGRK